MNRYLQIDAGVVTGELFADSAPATLPPGREFVEYPNDGSRAPFGQSFDREAGTIGDVPIIARHGQ